jgi:hypothetical protein
VITPREKTFAVDYHQRADVVFLHDARRAHQSRRCPAGGDAKPLRFKDGHVFHGERLLFVK